MGLTNEQKGEIRAAYRNAANPKKQITILAQLYATSKEEICKVLGIEAPEQKPKKTLRSYEQAVGGYIETVSFCEDALVICNEEGLLMGLAPNCSFLGIPFVGTILIAGRSGEEFCSLSHTAQQLLLSQLGAGKQL